LLRVYTTNIWQADIRCTRVIIIARLRLVEAGSQNKIARVHRTWIPIITFDRDVLAKTIGDQAEVGRTFVFVIAVDE
jgi:hypothetical protein